MWFLDADWQRNGAGKLTSASFGFGLFDAAKFVELAERWPPSIPDQQNCSLEWNPRLKEWTSESKIFSKMSIIHYVT
jgi:hypothetical protein